MNSVAGSQFLCSYEQESLCRASNHSTKRMQHIPVCNNPPDNIIKTWLSETINANITPRDRCISRHRRLSYTITDYLDYHISKLPSRLKPSTKFTVSFIKSDIQSVLVWAGMELIFFIIACMLLGFGLAMNTGLITEIF